MYLAPLNYDRFFKKVFSEIKIAKAFLEDFLDITIETIERLEDRQRFTDDAALVEFDYRCKIDGTYVIIDMQQWYKQDIGQRFFLYHALNTGMQLEKLPEKIVSKTPPVKKIKNYHTLEPVITLVWMAVDTLGFKDNFVSYCMTPELVAEFVKDENLWRNPDIVELLKSRTRVLNVLKNKTKGLGFIPRNRLIFVLQGNIVSNESHPRYKRWFTFAEKSRNDENKEEDFEEYKNDEIFKEIIRRLDHHILKPEEMQYLEEERKLWLQFSQMEQDIFENGIEVGIEKGIEKGIEVGIEKGKKEVVRNAIARGLSNEDISALTGFAVNDIDAVRDSL